MEDDEAELTLNKVEEEMMVISAFFTVCTHYCTFKIILYNLRAVIKLSGISLNKETSNSNFLVKSL